MMLIDPTKDPLGKICSPLPTARRHDRAGWTHGTQAHLKPLS
jgi:hypothetical protein